MSILASDNFTRANENPLSNSGNWTTVHSENAAQIVSDLCEGTVGGADNADYWSGLSWPSDQYAEQTIAALSSNSSMMALARVASSAESYYGAGVRGGSTTVGVYLANQGFLPGPFATGTLSAPPTAGDVLRVQVQGTTVSAYYNGVQLVSATDSTLSAGSAGFKLRPLNTGAIGTTQISEWDAGNFQQATPTFSPLPGTYTSPQTVTITSAGASAIYYTTDGSTPTTSSPLYSGPVMISTTTLLQAMATGTGLSNSNVASGTYTINLPQQPAPSFSPAPGTYVSAQSVTLTSAGASAIYYTLDGSSPTTGSTLYSGPILISSTTTIKALATASGYTNSNITSGVYTINPATFNAYRSVRGIGTGGGWVLGLPQTGTPGSLWFDTSTGALFVAVTNPYLPGESDSQDCTNVWRLGLTVIKGAAASMPSVLPIGTVYLTTDTLRAFAGTGVGVQQFRLNVGRALRGSVSTGQVPSPVPTTVFYVPVEGG